MFQFKQLFSFLTPQKKGTDKQPDPMKVGRAAYRKITSHGTDVNSDHLPFSQALGQFGWFPRPAPPGSIVVGIPAGNADGYVFPLGMLSGIFDGSQYDKALDSLKDAGNLELNINIPPNITSKLEENASGLSKWTKEIQEKGQNFKQNLLHGLPNDNTAYALMGNQLAPMRGITTGVDQAITSLSAANIALAGLQFLDIGNILNQLDISSLTTSMQATINNATLLLQQDINSTQPEWGAMSGIPVNLNGLVAQLQSTLDKATNEVEVLDLINVIQSNGFGESNSNTTITISTPFGELRQNVSSSGIVYHLDNDFQNIINTLQSIVGQIEQGANGKKLFSEEGTQMHEITGRMTDLDKQLDIHNFLKDLSNQFNDKKKRGRVKGTKGGNTQACHKQVVEKKEATMINNDVLSFIPVDRSGQ